jgi:hypothetical protein
VTGDHADLEHVEAVLAMMIISAREAQPFTPVEQVAVDAIVSLSQREAVGTARTHMAHLINARTRS